MRLGIDIDGVLADFNRSYVELFAKRGHTVTLPPQTWYYPEAQGIPADVIKDVWDEIANSKNFWTTLSPLASPAERARLFRVNLSHDIYFITTRAGVNVKKQTEQWLRVHLDIPSPTVLICPGDKGAVAESLSLDAAIDDRDKNLMSYDVVGTVDVYGIRQPWNDTQIRKFNYWVDTVHEFLDRVGV